MQRLAGTEELFPLKAEKKETNDIRNTFIQYSRYWYLFLIGVLLSVGAAFMYLRYHTSVQYKVVSKLLIKDYQRGQGISGAGAFSDLDMFNSTKVVDNEILILDSKTLMERVVKDLELFTNYYIEGQFQDIEIYGKELPIKLIVESLNSSGYNKELTIYTKDNNSFVLEEQDGKRSIHSFGKRIQKPYATFTVLATYKLNPTPSSNLNQVKVQFKNIQDVASRYHNSIKVMQAGKTWTNVISLELTDSKPERAKDILNKLVELYNKESIEDKNVLATNTLAFIDDRLKYLTTELSGVEKNVEQYKSQNEVTDVNTQASDYLAQASDYNKQLSEWAIQIDILRSIEKYLSQAKGEYRMVPSSLGIQDQTLMSLIAKFNELQLERERMLRTTNPNSPLIQNINEQLANLRVNLLENLGNIKRSLLITSNKLKATSSQFKSKIKKVPSMERQLLEINRQQSIKQNLYLYLLQKREETALSLASSVSHIRIIDPAIVEGFSVLPSKSTVYLMSVLLGLLIPFAGIYLRNILKNKIQTKKEIEDATNTPILGELCQKDSPDFVVVKKGSRAPIVELFRLIRAKLHFAAVDKENKVMLITSSMSGEGKTFFGINLAASLVLTGKKVLVIDLDLRSPRLSAELGLSTGLGVSNYLVSDKVQIHDLIRLTEMVPELYAISAGPIPPDPAEMMVSKKLGHLINEVKQSFDHIIIDTSPIGQVADALVLSTLVDSTIYLMRYNYTFRKQIEMIDEIYRNKTLPHPMIVLNDARKENGNGYGYGYGYENKYQSPTPSKELLS
ncbi:GumC family protein [Rufibacter roseolus]|uniref:GumC family protein n=1 Tax=Rufibacter roseolus TaxID=2817375 RepID=UPI001B3016C6|nr:tyrosine-protein kinase [Rufibacter roseolus]